MCDGDAAISGVGGAIPTGHLDRVGGTYALLPILELEPAEGWSAAFTRAGAVTVGGIAGA